MKQASLNSKTRKYSSRGCFRGWVGLIYTVHREALALVKYIGYLMKDPQLHKYLSFPRNSVLKQIFVKKLLFQHENLKYRKAG